MMHAFLHGLACAGVGNSEGEMRSLRLCLWLSCSQGCCWSKTAGCLLVNGLEVHGLCSMVKGASVVTWRSTAAHSCKTLLAGEQQARSTGCNAQAWRWAWCLAHASSSATRGTSAYKSPMAIARSRLTPRRHAVQRDTRRAWGARARSGCAAPSHPQPLLPGERRAGALRHRLGTRPHHLLEARGLRGLKHLRGHERTSAAASPRETKLPHMGWPGQCACTAAGAHPLPPGRVT